MKNLKLLIGCILMIFAAKAQNINTVAGNGTGGVLGNGGMAACAQLYNPTGIATDFAGNLYIADEGNSVVRKVSPTGIISLFAGGGNDSSNGDGGKAVDASLSIPVDVTVDAVGNIYIVDMGSHCVRKVDTNGIISTIAGNGFAGFNGDGGVATSASLFYPQGIAVYSDIIYIADQSSRIRKIQNGIISTIAGTGINGFGGDGSLAATSKLNQPYGMTCDSYGNLYIADSQNNRIRVIIMSTGIINTIAGRGTVGYSGDNNISVNAELNFPTDVVINGSELYISDAQNYRIRKVYKDTITTLTGDGVSGYNGDNGSALLAEIGPINSIVMDQMGNVYISDFGNNVIRKINGNNMVTEKKESFSFSKFVNVFPNPTINELMISMPTSEKTSLYLTDEVGKILISLENNSIQTTINMSEYKSGEYYLHLKVANGKEDIRKIIKSE